jgi:hypothetical protein
VGKDQLGEHKQKGQNLEKKNWNLMVKRILE